MKRKASAIWNGSGKEGGGYLTTETGVLNNVGYTFASRFEDGIGTNPEELIGAAFAGCFSMKLSFIIGEGGFKPETIQTQATVSIEEGTINKIDLEVKAKVLGLNDQQFSEMAEKARQTCPVGKLLNTNITVKSSLIERS